MKLKTFENFNDEEIGELLLIYNGESPTTWFYIEDAIINGLLDDRFQLDEDIVEQIGQTCFYEEYVTQGDLCQIIIDDFDSSLQRIFEYLLENDIIDNEATVEIKGKDEDGEEWDFYYEPSEELIYKNQVRKTGKKYNI